MIMKMDTNTVMATCPKCGEDVRLPGQCRAGETIFCRSCESEFEIVRTNPPVLDWLHIQDYESSFDDDLAYF